MSLEPIDQARLPLAGGGFAHVPRRRIAIVQPGLVTLDDGQVIRVAGPPESATASHSRVAAHHRPSGWPRDLPPDFLDDAIL